VATGDLDRATGLVTWMREVGRRTERAWTVATGERSHASLLAAHGDVEGATIAIRHALAAHEHLAMPFELARTHLVQGDLERRRKHRSSARSSLEAALEIFDRLGAELWARKARESIARLGIRTEAQLQLTPVEDRIARLAADGRTNREIAGLLFVSRKTVEANLSRIYRKLGIRSRASLASAISTSPLAPNGVDSAAAREGPRVTA
jgi:DNA-binding CsgD family transcriptional regulator